MPNQKSCSNSSKFSKNREICDGTLFNGFVFFINELVKFIFIWFLEFVIKVGDFIF